MHNDQLLQSQNRIHARKNLWIVGGGGAALEVWAVAQLLATTDVFPVVRGFITPDGACHFKIDGLTSISESEFLKSGSPSEDVIVLGIGKPEVRRQVSDIFRQSGFTFATLVHPRAIIGPQVVLGSGTVVMAGAVLETHLSIGQHCLINVLCSVAHDCVISDYCNLGPGVHLAGAVCLGPGSDLGIGSVARPGVKLGPQTIAGAGTVLIKDFAGMGTLIGVPGRQLS